MQYLLEELNIDSNVEDKEGRTPLPALTKNGQMIQLLLKHGALVNNVYKIYSSLLGKLASERPPDNPVPILFIGDSGAGKSTLLKALLSSKIFRANFVKAKPVTGVDERTVGIVPYEIETKEFGRAICYDLAGKQEFCASHCAVLENIVQTPIIVYNANLQNSYQKITESTIHWMTLVQNQCTSLSGKAHVIVIGSHADKVKENGENPLNKESIFAPIIRKFSKLELIAFTPMDCRHPDTNQIKEIQIQKSSAIIRSPEAVSLNAHAFYIYLLDSFKAELAVSLIDVKERIHNDLKQTPSKRVKNLLLFHSKHHSSSGRDL